MGYRKFPHRRHTGPGWSGRDNIERMVADRVREGDVVRVPSLAGPADRLKILRAYPAGSDGTVNVDVLDLRTCREEALSLQGFGHLHAVECGHLHAV